jgi:hypothetical protein
MILLIVINTIICGVLIKTYFMQRNSYENIFQRIEYTNTLVLNLKDINIEHYDSIYKKLDKANDHLIGIEVSSKNIREETQEVRSELQSLNHAYWDKNRT